MGYFTFYHGHCGVVRRPARHFICSGEKQRFWGATDHVVAELIAPEAVIFLCNYFRYYLVDTVTEPDQNYKFCNYVYCEWLESN